MRNRVFTHGFTLVETIIYIGLFGIMFTGIFVSIYPLFTGAEKLSRDVATETETAFILAKIRYALNNTIISTEGHVATPDQGNTGNTLRLTFSGTDQYEFQNTDCHAPLTCKQLSLKVGTDELLPLNTDRVDIRDFTVTHVAPSGEVPRYIDVSFTANGDTVGPVRYYLHF